MESLLSEIERDIIEPSKEIGAFEALWANGISSFKQLREKLTSSNTTLPGYLIDSLTAENYYKRAVARLNAAGIEEFGVRIDGTIDYPTKLRDADYPLVLFYYRGIWDLAYPKGVAVVGTRKPSSDGIKCTRKLVKALVIFTRFHS